MAALGRVLSLVLFAICVAPPALADAPGDTPVVDSSQTPGASSSPSLIVRFGAIAAPGLGAMGGIDARVVKDLYFGFEGGVFSAYGYGQWFGNARASYRVRLTDHLRLVPSIGVAHVGASRLATDDYVVVREAPISPNGGLGLSLSLGQFVLGAQAEVLPVLLTENLRAAGPFDVATERTRTLFDVPVSIYAGLAM